MTDTPTRADLIERLTYWAQFGYGVEATRTMLDAARAALKGTDNDPAQIEGQEA